MNREARGPRPVLTQSPQNCPFPVMRWSHPQVELVRQQICMGHDMIALLLAGTFVGYLFAGVAWFLGASLIQALAVLSITGVTATLAFATMRIRAEEDCEPRRRVAA